MLCGSHEASKHKYKLLIGKSGKRWVVSTDANAADHVYVDGGKGSDGFGGRTLTFELEDGTTVDFIGPWKTTADGLFNDTEYDVRNTRATKGIVAQQRELGKPFGAPDTYIDVLHEDEDFVLGTYTRIDEIAQQFADELGVKIAYGLISEGGGYTGWATPKTGGKS
jgi:hypothetical protein